eukprot:14523134-Heterocapsa_arctica.AAC.1
MRRSQAAVRGRAIIDVAKEIKDKERGRCPTSSRWATAARARCRRTRSSSWRRRRDACSTRP